MELRKVSMDLYQNTGLHGEEMLRKIPLKHNVMLQDVKFIVDNITVNVVTIRVFNSLKRKALLWICGLYKIKR